jgi:hypothetical protein
MFIIAPRQRRPFRLAAGFPIYSRLQALDIQGRNSVQSMGGKGHVQRRYDVTMSAFKWLLWCGVISVSGGFQLTGRNVSGISQIIGWLVNRAGRIGPDVK